MLESCRKIDLIGDNSDVQGATLAVSKRWAKELPRVAAAWRKAGGVVKVVDRFWSDQGVVPNGTKLYGNDAFCRTVAEASDLSLISPRDELLAELDKEWIHRGIEVRRYSEVITYPPDRWPLFIKPVEPKKFSAGVLHSPAELRSRFQCLPGSTEVLVSEVVTFGNEARAFVIDGRVADCSFYVGGGDRLGAIRFVSSLATTYRDQLPNVFVVDVGQVDGAWAVIEFNAVWAAQPRRCNPNLIIACIAAATQ